MFHPARFLRFFRLRVGFELIRSLGAACGGSGYPGAHSMNFSEFMVSVSKRLLPLVPFNLVVDQVLPNL